MKKIILASLTAFIGAFAAHSAQAAPETYTLDPSHTTVIWHANHVGFSNPTGLFPLVNGTITLDDANPANSKVTATIETGLISTGNPKFNEHLSSKDFFNVAEFATATFVSDKVETTGADTAKVTGNLTLLGVSKPVTLDVKLNKSGDHPFTKKKTVGFSATATLKRSDFGLSYGIPNVSDEIPLNIEAEASVQ